MSRRDIYYWKCDRPAAFYGTQMRAAPDAAMHQQLELAMKLHFNTNNVALAPAASQGNHLTWHALIGGKPLFVRVENGPEHDDNLEMESRVLEEVRLTGVPTPCVHGFDASRVHVPFAWQAMDRVAHPDLNHWQKQGQLELHNLAVEIGAAIACWQSIRPKGFGPLDVKVLRRANEFRGYHHNYETYFRLHLERHVAFLVDQSFLTHSEAAEILAAIEEHRLLLNLQQGCLVHKDLALWNILGTPSSITAFVDFDDSISGDPMDDFSLLGCFHSGDIVTCALEGYQSVRPLPPEYRRRFWLHLLRNMIVKAVIRVGAGYFNRSNDFFLIGSDSNGADLRTFTHQRLHQALQYLRKNADIAAL